MNQKEKRFRKAADRLEEAYEHTGKIHVDDLGESNTQELRDLRARMEEWQSLLEEWADELEEPDA